MAGFLRCLARNLERDESEGICLECKALKVGNPNTKKKTELDPGNFSPVVTVKKSYGRLVFVTDQCQSSFLCVIFVSLYSVARQFNVQLKEHILLRLVPMLR